MLNVSMIVLVAIIIIINNNNNSTCKVTNVALMETIL